MSDSGQMYPQLYLYRRRRRKFSFQVYLIVIIFVIITVAQWGAFYIIDLIKDGLKKEIKDIFMKHYYISIITLLAALLLVTLFVIFERFRFAMPFNWIASMLIIELETVGLGRIVVATSIENFAYSLAVAYVVTVLFIAIGIFITRDLTADVIIIFACAIVFFMGSVFFVMVAIVFDLSYSLMVYFGVIIATVLMFLMYHAQTIHGGRYAEMRTNDYLLAAFIIYHDYIILAILSMVISSAIAEENKLFNIYKNSSCGGKC